MIRMMMMVTVSDGERDVSVTGPELSAMLDCCADRQSTQSPGRASPTFGSILKGRVCL